MKHLSFLSVPALLITLLVAPQAEATDLSSSVELRLKASYNEMVQNVRQANDPVEKREVIAGFLNRMDRSMGVIEKMVPASQNAHIQAVAMRETLRGQLAELNGMNTQGPTAGNNLNNFAAYLQQDVERADGIYLSVGAAIIILLILIILL